MVRHYLDCVSSIERLHRLFLDVIKAELDAMRIRDISNVQCMILYSIGGEQISVGELTQRGYFLGSNVSYNLKKMVEADYLVQQRSPHDRRSVHVRLTDKGQQMWKALEAVFQRHCTLLEAAEIHESGLIDANRQLEHLERFWNLARNSVPRPPEPLLGREVTPEEAATYFQTQKRSA